MRVIFQVTLESFQIITCEVANLDWIIISYVIHNVFITLPGIWLAIVVGRLDMYRTKVLLYHTMVLLARPTKVRR